MTTTTDTLAFIVDNNGSAVLGSRLTSSASFLSGMLGMILALALLFLI